ncbi:hypothetical protein J3R82DRAFT_6947 [Butyriboletus roseoflavus]|nr:hypothetical protein J3R82DRAFT_6947 [Butyriboletus roseoflavus]
MSICRSAARKCRVYSNQLRGVKGTLVGENISDASGEVFHGVQHPLSFANPRLSSSGIDRLSVSGNCLSKSYPHRVLRFTHFNTALILQHSFQGRRLTDMFTPPPSPLPPTRQVSPSKLDADASDLIQTGSPIEDPCHPLPRQRSHLSIRWAIVLVPLVLILLAASTRSQVHPAVFGLLSTGDNNPKWTKVADWSLHEPHKAKSNRLVKKSTSNRLLTSNTTNPAPTVPVNPPLPTPFPQPFDTTLSANFSTTRLLRLFFEYDGNGCVSCLSTIFLVDCYLRRISRGGFCFRSSLGKCE